MDVEIPVTEARAQFSELVNRVGYGKERIVLTRHGRPLVALVPASDLGATPSAGSATETVLDLSAQPERQRSSYDVAAEDSSDHRL